MRRVILLLFALLASVGLAMGQVRTVTGVVTDAADGSPLPQATIKIKGTQNGTVTDGQGHFSLRVPGPEAVLEFSYTGYEPQEVAVGEQSTFNIKLAVANEEIEGVVITAFGSQKKTSLTGAIASVDEKKLEKLPGADVAKAMEGQLAGVQMQSSGAPGSSPVIRIRGIGSINASSAPLIIVDGAPYTNTINTINPADIASYNVLKDAASAALYGARGANGVILITTKSGRKGQAVVNYDGRFGVNMRGLREYDIIRDPAEYLQMAWQALRMQLYVEGTKDGGIPITLEEAGIKASEDLYKEMGGYKLFKDVDVKEYILPDGSINPKLKSAGYIFEDKGWNDWEKAIFKPSFRQEHNLSVSKGTDGTKVFFSASYLDDKGYSIGSYFKRITTRLNVTQQIYSWLEFSNKVQYTYSDINENLQGGFASNPFLFIYSISPLYPIYKHDAAGRIAKDENGDILYEDGKGYVDDADPNNSVAAFTSGQAVNPALTQEKELRRNLESQFNEQASLNFILPWNITIQANVAYSGTFGRYITRQYPFGDAKGYDGRLADERYDRNGINFNQIIDWNWSFLEHDALNLAIKLGHESYMTKYSYMSGAKVRLLYPETLKLDEAGEIKDFGGNSNEYRLEGYFAQASVNYLERYFLSASFRTDGSSVFHPKHRWGSFWSIGASWRISQEPFFQPVTKYVNNLKLRLSYGLQGNDNLRLGRSRSYLPYQDLFSVSSDGKELGISNAAKGNEKVTWEKNYNLSLALEFGVFRSMVSGEIEFFTRTTRDMLFNLPLPAATGFSSIPTNIGDMRNTGVELTMNVNPVRMKNINLDINFNLTHYKNKILKLPDEFKKDGIPDGSRRIKEGHGIYDWHTLHYEGVDPNSGLPMYRYREDEKAPWMVGTRSKYHEFAIQSREFTGTTSLPDVQGGFGFVLDAYGVDFSAQFSYAIGGQVFDDTYGNLMSSGNLLQGWHQDIKKSWSPENLKGKTPRLEWKNTNGEASDRYLITASHLAFKSIMLGYTLPQEWTRKFFVQQFRIYFVCDNVWLWSARKGFDPRMSIFSGGAHGVYTPIRTLAGGIQLRF